MNIKSLTKNLKQKFKLENPQIEISEIKDSNLDARIVAERVQSTLERFGSKRFKGVGHKTMDDVMKAGAMGCEILISGKIPSSRAKRWRFYQGYLKKSGDVAVSQVNTAYTGAQLKSGIVGIQVRIMLPDTDLPDNVELKKIEIVEEQDLSEKELSEITKKSEIKEDKKETKKEDKTKEDKKEDKKKSSEKKSKSTKTESKSKKQEKDAE
jgi:small subunit ribosomal protein S3